MNDQAATELEQYISSDGQLYRSQTTSVLRALATKKARGAYKHDLAVKAFGYLVEAGAKKYAKEHGSPGQSWYQLFPASTRKVVAEELTRAFEGEHALGNYADLLPKKYQPKSTGHARKSMGAYEAEGYEAHSWRLTDCPYSQPKIRDAWQRGAWKWQQEQRSQRPASAHATRAKSGLHMKMHTPGALRSASDRQLRDFYRDEKRDVSRARAEAARRGLPLHARKKQLDRDIAEVLARAEKRRTPAVGRKV